MPKIRNESRASSSRSPQRDTKFIVFTDGKRRVLLTRNILSGSYDDALDVLSGHFSSIPRSKMTLQTNTLEACEGEYVDIPRESWSEALPHLYSVMLVEGDEQPPRPTPRASSSLLTPESSLSSIDKTTITIQGSTGRRVEFEVKSLNSLVSSLLTSFCSHLKVEYASTNLYDGTTLLSKTESFAAQGISNGAILTAHTGSLPPTPTKQKFTLYIVDGSERYGFMVSSNTLISSIRSSYIKRFQKGGDGYVPAFVYNSNRLSDSDRVGDLGIQEGGEIDAFQEQCGGKPVIYLFSPEPVQARVRLSLVKEWSFSAIYPVVPIKTHAPIGQTLEWRVNTHQDGTLTEQTTGLRASYLFWEAETTAIRPLSPPPSPSDGPVFNPVHSTLTDADSVVLPVSKITPYLDASLSALSLHVEARTSFITYWLPSILKHTHIALRFVPQAAYEKAAPMEVSPQPDVLTRVFMLWKGVNEAELKSGAWKEAVQRATMDVEVWKGVVGIQEYPSMHDQSVFRVLEWGGMEVKI